jgi:hypothetical protein
MKLELVSFKELFSLRKLVTFLLAILFLYWGLYSNLVFPIIGVVENPVPMAVFVAILRIFLLSGICVSLGLTFTTMTFFTKESIMNVRVHLHFDKLLSVRLTAGRFQFRGTNIGSNPILTTKSLIIIIP